MKIGDRCFVHGIVYEIRKDTVIVRNNGGYFGTDPSEVDVGDLPKRRKTGKWALGGYEDMYYICNHCGYKRSQYYAKPTAKYCEECGVKMEEGEQE